MSGDETLPHAVSNPDGWRAHELSQLRRFRALSLRQKLEAVECMADVVRRLNQMRREGTFRSGSQSAKPGETTNKQAAGEPTLPDKPRSRMQRYRTTEAGREAIVRKAGR